MFYETTYTNVTIDGELIDISYKELLLEYRIIGRETNIRFTKKVKYTDVIRICVIKSQLKLKL